MCATVMKGNSASVKNFVLTFLSRAEFPSRDMKSYRLKSYASLPPSLPLTLLPSTSFRESTTCLMLLVRDAWQPGNPLFSSFPHLVSYIVL